MFLGKVKKTIVSEYKHEAYRDRTVYVVESVNPDGKGIGTEWVAMDYVGAGIGDIVVCGGAPGVSREVFKLKKPRSEP